MKTNDEIIQKLEEFDFHDLPVKSYKFNFDPESIFEISFFLHIEETNDYDVYLLTFKKIKSLNVQAIAIEEDADIEIYGFDYELGEVFKCKLMLVTGFGGPSQEIQLTCEEIYLENIKIK